MNHRAVHLRFLFRTFQHVMCSIDTSLSPLSNLRFLILYGLLDPLIGGEGVRLLDICDT